MLNDRTGNIRMVFECPTNPSNVWAALRTFDSFGIQYADVIFDDHDQSPIKNQSTTNVSRCGSTSGSNSNSELDALRAKTKEESVLHVKAKVNRKRLMMTSMGSHKWLSLRQHSSTEACLKSLKAEGYRVYASDLHDGSKSLMDLQLSVATNSSHNNNSNDSGRKDESIGDTYGGKIAILFGKEETGISEVARRLADERFFIPMKGFAESFNLSASCAITTTHLASKGLMSSKLTKKERDVVYLTWLTRSVRNAEGILRKYNAKVPRGLPDVSDDE